MTVALAGNPNVGKSTLFNALTGMHQHTGNWTGKTVESAMGYHERDGRRYRIVDLPGCYSLFACSEEERSACDYLCADEADAVVIVCDATHPERNLGLVLQILALGMRTVVVLNLMDEAKRLGISVDAEALSQRLGVLVVTASAARGQGIDAILSALDRAEAAHHGGVRYDGAIEEAVRTVSEALAPYEPRAARRRFFALRLLEGGETDRFSTKDVENAVSDARRKLALAGVSHDAVTERIASGVMREASSLAHSVTGGTQRCAGFSRADRVLTSRAFGIPIMLSLLLLVFWITAVGANIPSAWLSALFDAGEAPLMTLLTWLTVPRMLCELIVYGIYRTLSWIVSVMLPPMLIFFPLFTVLEDIGYLPRMAFNLDGAFCRCGACGKQGLTMCMGLGCNAVGVTGARIIGSERERTIAILTNAFIPCNGRFPALIAVSAAFFARVGGMTAIVSALAAVLAVTLGVVMSFGVSWLLSHTLLRGASSSMLLELPPFRRPKLGGILVRSFLDRTLRVLARAVTVAIPAGAVIWLVTHVTVGDVTVAAYLSSLLDPLGRVMGLDGVILLAFLLGLPANEIVLPLCLMLYRAEGVLTEYAGGETLLATLVANGWTWRTAVCFLILTVLHAPCLTTLLTIRRETGSARMTALALFIPTLCGVLLCMAVRGGIAFFS
ncbi:MAG: ferrous iron transport protein B [Clostridia bacterium]|nr:ferrous iron transport protein B [Clostridia bacterium]